MVYDLEIKYQSGTSNRVVDALSRKVNPNSEMCNMESVCSVVWETIQKEINRDPYIGQLL